MDPGVSGFGLLWLFGHLDMGHAALEASRSQGVVSLLMDTVGACVGSFKSDLVWLVLVFSDVITLVP